MKKFIIPLLACTALAGGLAFAEAAKPGHSLMGMHHMDGADMQRHHAEMCSNMVAMEAGHMAFIDTKLALSGAQEAAFNRWKDVKLDQAKARSAKCSSMAMPDRDGMHSPLEHMAHEEERLKMRLADLQAERPALSAFYGSLNDAQKRVFAKAGPHGMHGGPGMMHRGMGHHMHGGPDGGHMSGSGGPDGDDGPPPGE